MVEAGTFETMKVLRMVDFGAYLDDREKGVLLPKRFIPEGLKEGDEIKVFLYHDSENRMIATTQTPKGKLGDIVSLTCVSSTAQGAFLDWGLMKDLFVPKSQQITPMVKGEDYLVKIYCDEQTKRVAATQKIDRYLNTEAVDLKELQQVELLVYRRSDIGYVVIIQNKYSGILHFNDVFMEIKPGNVYEGYIKNIKEDNKIDVALGKPGYQRVENEKQKILRLLQENHGFLPYNDKSKPEDIYSFFGMSKKVFKMTTGSLFKDKKIIFLPEGIRSVD